MSQKKVRQVKCPRCQAESEFSPENPFRPFCSRRCQLIDLGDWAEEKFRIPTGDSGSLSSDENDEDLF